MGLAGPLLHPGLCPPGPSKKHAPGPDSEVALPLGLAFRGRTSQQCRIRGHHPLIPLMPPEPRERSVSSNSRKMKGRVWSLDWPLPRAPETWPLFLGASGTAKSPHCQPTWEASHGIPALLDSLEAFCVTQGWAPTLSGLGLWSGHGSKRLCPQLAWKAVSGGAARLDRLPAPGPGCRPPGARDKDSPHRVCGESMACPHLTGSQASLCPPQSVGPGGWTSPHGSSENPATPGLQGGGGPGLRAVL